MQENDYTGTTNSKCHIKRTENTCIIIFIAIVDYEYHTHYKIIMLNCRTIIVLILLTAAVLKR